MSSGVTSFRAHAAAGDHGPLFNFVGPRSRRWSKKKRQVAEREAAPAKPVEKKASQDALNWDPWTVMAQLGYGQEAMTPDTGFAAPETYQRLYPLLQAYAASDPDKARALIEANRLAQGRVSDYIAKGGMPESTGLFSAENLKRFFRPRDTAMDPQRVQQLYNEAKAQAVNELMNRGVDSLTAARVADDSVGTLEDFQKRIADQALNSGQLGRMAFEDVAPLAWFGGAPIALALKGTELGLSESGRALLGDEKARANLQAAIQGRLERDALNNQTGLGLWDVGAGLASGLFGGLDPGTVQVGAGLEQLRSAGTVQNRILLERLKRQEDLERNMHEMNLARQPLLQHSLGGMRDIETAKQRFLTQVSPEDEMSREIFDRAEAAAKNPYRNVATLDFGGSTAIESGRSPFSRLVRPSEWGSLVQDWMSGSDSSHQFMMGADDTAFDEQGFGRFQPYQQAHRMFAKGRFDPRYDDLSAIRIANPGQELTGIDPRRLFGVTHQGKVEGMDPAQAREAWDKHWGSLIDRGLASEQDIQNMRRRLQGNPQLAQAVDFENRVANQWNRNRWNAGRSLQSQIMQDLMNPAPRTPAGPEVPAPATAAAAPAAPAPNTGMSKAARAKVARWAKTAKPDWYARFEEGQKADTGYDLAEWYKYQEGLRKRFARELQRGALTGTGMTEEDEAYGRGLRERWTKFGPGRYAHNYYGLFGPMMSTSDMQRLDPVLAKHREAIAAGQWRPGMQVDPLIVRSGFGWTNPLGYLSEFLGITDNPLAQERKLTKGIVGSKNFQDIWKDYKAGLIPEKDFLHMTRGINVASQVPGYTEGMREAKRQAAVGSVRRFAELAKDIDENMYTTAPLTQATRY